MTHPLTFRKELSLSFKNNTTADILEIRTYNPNLVTFTNKSTKNFYLDVTLSTVRFLHALIRRIR